MNKIVLFIKNEIVLIISFVLAFVSMFFASPGEGYVDYIDFRTLALLFSLMAVMEGIDRLGVFSLAAEKLLSKVKTLSGVTLTLVLLCFFASMVITNDVALITFVPFTIVTLRLASAFGKLIYVVALETIAANLGSMLTPIGNPQNLYLFSKFNMSAEDFFVTIYPYALLSLVLLCVCAVFSGKSCVSIQKIRPDQRTDKRLLIMYVLLFLICLLGVFRAVHYAVLFFIVFSVVLVFDRKTLTRVDYSLLLTFVFLFVFIGNLSHIDTVSTILKSLVNGNEVATGIISSQVLSNVPAAILLSGFTNDAPSLLLGVNLGGLGTLIASMASLISFKFIQKESVSTAKYLLVFTICNMVFLAANIVLYNIY